MTVCIPVSAVRFTVMILKNDELPDIQRGIAVIVDSVINTGKSILSMIGNFRQSNPDIEIVIVTNVIQENAVNLL